MYEPCGGGWREQAITLIDLVRSDQGVSALVLATSFFRRNFAAKLMLFRGFAVDLSGLSGLGINGPF